MAKKIDWLDNFAESYSKEMNKKTASRVKNEVIIERSLVKGAKIGDKVKLNGKMYKIADLDFEDEKGSGVVIEEIEEVPVEMAPIMDVPSMSANDPMEMEMGANPASLGDNACTVAPERAVADPGPIYDLDVRSQEQSKFEEEAAETEQKIQSDAVNIDLTQRSHEVKPAAPEQVVAPVVEEPAMEEPAMEEPMVEEPVVEDEVPAEDSEVCPECGSEECPGCGDEECPGCEEDEVKEEDEEMKPLASNRIFRRIMASKRR